MRNKLLAEKAIIKLAKRKKLDHNIEIFSSIYGTRIKKQLIWDAINKFKKRFYFYGTGDEIRSWMFVDDVIKLIIILIKNYQQKKTKYLTFRL